MAWICSLVAILLTVSGSMASDPGVPGGRCATPSNCCVGRDSSCMVSVVEAQGEEVYARPCYCDEGCLETGDCCQDYKQVCNVKVVHCEVSLWSEWTACDRSCGKGVQTRNRVVTQHPSPLGQRCGKLSQRRGCMGTRCSAKYRKYKSPIRETAALLPAKYLKLRSESSWDVRDNLFMHRKSLREQEQQQSNFVHGDDLDDDYQSDQPREDSGYCIVFELEKVTSACQRDKDFLMMKKGQQLCALCPADAKRESLGGRCKGHGVDRKLTRWRSTILPRCHGKWRRVHEMGECPRNLCQRGADFVFV